jgi:DnaJ family protein C protein 19
MATTFLLGAGAVAAALAGRHLIKRAGMGAAEQWAKGGFKAKMDKQEAIAILGLKCIMILFFI